ncbi:Pycsar system effector family protein [Archangium violaceum]|uniref:Pycsar system effector family protein n=1 Tax=Archangium violaceum TaxID=83451 RepID=UPI0036DC2D6B
MEQRLQYILSQVNDWLKFAEAKNAALVAASIATIIGLLQANIKPDPPPNSFQIIHSFKFFYLNSLPWLLGCSGLISLISFLPKTTIPFITSKAGKKDTDNLLFFGDIAKYDTDDYTKALQKSWQTTPSSIGDESKHLSEQIVVNSGIAVWKYSCFKLALWFAIAAAATPIAAIIIYIAFKTTPRLR